MKVDGTPARKEEIYRHGKEIKGVGSSGYAHNILNICINCQKLKRKYPKIKTKEEIHQPPEHFKHMRDLDV